MHSNIVDFEVTGDYGLFTDPLTQVGGEKCTVQVPTYEALKGILQSVYWKPTLIWVIDKVRVMNQIQTETKGIRTLAYTNGKSDLSYYTYLKNCRYQVRAHFEWNLNRPQLTADRNENKHHNIARRMVEKGGRRDIFLGTRECQGYVEPCVFGEGEGFYDDTPELTFGLMLHGITYPDEVNLKENEQAQSNPTERKDRRTVRFWRPVMKKGVITFWRPEACEILRHVTAGKKKSEIKLFSEESGNFSGLREFGEVN